ncbi:hypothetical protein SI65_08458 [Aspergillus cristatus]|uniref:Uncharacterized protein n=1 Tax=Aspergillus cristatus TaxID=573508 RepID=A0A1E3B533_ASPCR|nr:hypothetical protein SI65_08458 [Aspergillus cristatus]
MPVSIPQFLLPRGIPSARTLRTLRHHHRIIPTASTSSPRTLTTSPISHSQDPSKPRVLVQPDKFRPPSHPARRVVQTRNGKVVNAGPVNYPGPKLSEKEKEEQKTRQYPNMFPPEGTVMFKFLTSRWIHVWIAMGILTSLATFTFTTNFKRTSPYAHLLPSWSNLLSHPYDTISQALSVYRMDVEHRSMLTREKRLQRVEDAEKRRKYRVAHGMEEDTQKEEKKEVVDDQSPVARDVDGKGEAFVDWEGNKKPVKKWFGIW